MKRFYLLLLTLTVIISACSVAETEDFVGIKSNTTDIPTTITQPTETLNPTITPTLAAPFLKVRMMAYNICFGAGVEPGHKECGSNKNRLAELITLVKQANPDILGLEEVYRWESGNPSIISKFAKAVNMNYFLAPTWFGLHNAIFSKFPIIETENLSEYVGTNGALRAVLQTPDGQNLNVIIAHLDPIDQAHRACQFDILRMAMESRSDQPGILMGDINAIPDAPEVKYLTQGGWELVQSETWWRIDNIYILTKKAWSKENICFTPPISSNPDCIPHKDISDHIPVGAVISFYDASNPVSIPSLLTPTLASKQTELPEIVSTTLKGVKMQEREPYGESTVCENNIARRKALEKNQAALLRFRFTGPPEGSKFFIALENHNWGESGYQRFGIGGGIGGNNSIFFLEGKIGANNIDLKPKTNNLALESGKWYSLLFAVGKNGEIRSIVWDPESPAQRFEGSNPPAPSLARDSWRFTTDSYLGQLEFDEYQLLEFDGFQ